MFGPDGAARIECALEAIEFLTDDEAVEFVLRAKEIIQEKIGQLDD